ncbi:hypothetical protein ID856_13350 [Xenorhabdus sp. 18]|uniref:hypothetical protein n=1 Tax=Xenorhabdus doucetiae TaxID=351671 RepID=UPI00199F81BE|nr:hypothetical protein [Xenorhabdus sp. 18]MBD2797515.1 hypothetical protein [Xenorhabdus sp. 18]
MAKYIINVGTLRPNFFAGAYTKISVTITKDGNPTGMDGEYIFLTNPDQVANVQTQFAIQQTAGIQPTATAELFINLTTSMVTNIDFYVGKTIKDATLAENNLKITDIQTITIKYLGSNSTHIIDIQNTNAALTLPFSVVDNRGLPIENAYINILSSLSQSTVDEKGTFFLKAKMTDINGQAVDVSIANEQYLYVYSPSIKTPKPDGSNVQFNFTNIPTLKATWSTLLIPDITTGLMTRLGTVIFYDSHNHDIKLPVASIHGIDPSGGDINSLPGDNVTLLAPASDSTREGVFAVFFVNNGAPITGMVKTFRPQATVNKTIFKTLDPPPGTLNTVKYILTKKGGDVALSFYSQIYLYEQSSPKEPSPNGIYIAPYFNEEPSLLTSGAKPFTPMYIPIGGYPDETFLNGKVTVNIYIKAYQPLANTGTYLKINKILSVESDKITPAELIAGIAKVEFNDNQLDNLTSQGSLSDLPGGIIVQYYNHNTRKFSNYAFYGIETLY